MKTDPETYQVIAELVSSDARTTHIFIIQKPLHIEQRLEVIESNPSAN